MTDAVGERSSKTPAGAPLKLSISVGVVLIDEQAGIDGAVLAATDRAMYDEKRQRARAVG